MSYVQVRSPNLALKEYAGYCHRLIRRVYGAPAVEPSAWQAWLRAKGRHTGAHPTNVSVPIWFSHWGTYGGVYDNYGHVVAYVPGRGYMSSPHSGYGVLWFSTIAAVERAFNAKYVGWTTDISTVTVVKAAPKPTPKPAPKPKHQGDIEMRTIYNSQDRNNETRRAVIGEFTFHVQGPSASTLERKFWGKPVSVNQREWDAELRMVNDRRVMAGLKPLKGKRGESGEWR